MHILFDIQTLDRVLSTELTSRLFFSRIRNQILGVKELEN